MGCSRALQSVPNTRGVPEASPVWLKLKKTIACRQKGVRIPGRQERKGTTSESPEQECPKPVPWV